MKPNLSECIVCLEQILDGDCCVMDITDKDIEAILKYLRKYSELLDMLWRVNDDDWY